MKFFVPSVCMAALLLSVPVAASREDKEKLQLGAESKRDVMANNVESKMDARHLYSSNKKQGPPAAVPAGAMRNARMNELNKVHQEKPMKAKPSHGGKYGPLADQAKSPNQQTLRGVNPTRKSPNHISEPNREKMSFKAQEYKASANMNSPRLSNDPKPTRRNGAHTRTPPEAGAAKAVQETNVPTKKMKLPSNLRGVAHRGHSVNQEMSPLSAGHGTSRRSADHEN